MRSRFPTLQYHVMVTHSLIHSTTIERRVGPRAALACVRRRVSAWLLARAVTIREHTPMFLGRARRVRRESLTPEGQGCLRQTKGTSGSRSYGTRGAGRDAGCCPRRLSSSSTHLGPCRGGVLSSQPGQPPRRPGRGGCAPSCATRLPCCRRCTGSPCRRSTCSCRPSSRRTRAWTRSASCCR